MTSTANSTVPAGSTARWRDKKRHLWLIGLVVPSLAFIGYGVWAATGLGGFFWIGPVVILLVVPAIDLVAGLDRSNPPDDVIEALENDRYYRWVTYLFLPIQYVGFVGAFYLITQGDPASLLGWQGQGELTTFEKVGLAVSIGSIGGIGINTAQPTSSDTSARPTNVGSPRSPWPRASTATSTSSTTGATTSGWPPPRIPRAHAWARPSTPSGRAR